MNYYFLPAAYDISPFTGYSIWEPLAPVDNMPLMSISCKDFYSEKVSYNDKGKVSIPPIYTLFESINTSDMANSNLGEMIRLYNYGDNNRNNIVMTDTMWRVLNDDVSIDSVINAYIAPWTLYSGGVFYTWPELMAMSDDELDALDFESYEFSKFISNVKSELESRGWWEKEYNEKYEKLLLHKDDYVNSLNKDEIFKIDGMDIYLERVDEEFNSTDTPNLNNIISVNIYDKDFIEIINGLDGNIAEKYAKLVEALNNEYDYNIREDRHNRNEKIYKDIFATDDVPDSDYACTFELEELALIFDSSNEIKGEMQFVNMIFKCGLDENQIRDTVLRYNYIYGESVSFSEEVISKMLNSTKEELIRYFAYDTSVILNTEDEISIIPWAMVNYSDWKSGDYDDKILSRVSNFNGVKEKMNFIYNNTSDELKSQVKANIEYLEEYASNNKPVTGDNSVLYVIIAAASLTAMSALAFRRKRKTNV